MVFVKQYHTLQYAQLCHLCGENHQTEDEVQTTPKRARLAVNNLAEFDWCADDETDAGAADTTIENDDSENDDSYNPDMTSTLNESLLNLSGPWTPIAPVLKRDFGQTSSSRQYEILQKSKQAIETVLETIAPGQSDVVMRHCWIVIYMFIYKVSDRSSQVYRT